MAVHSLQFVVSRADRPPLENWRSHPVAGGWWLHHCPKLPASVASTKDGKQALLLGWAYQVKADEDDPEALQSMLGAEGLAASYRSWTGRWLLLIDDVLHGDATCSIPIFYGHRLVSSSLSLLQQLSGAREKTDQEVVYGFGPDWHPAPSTPLADVSRLLASQTLLLSNFTPQYRPLLNRVTDSDPSRSFGEALFNGMRRLGAARKHVYVALTGGLDSRTVLSSACAAGLRPFGYTQDHPLLAPGDRQLPPLLAGKLGVPHHFIGPRGFDARKQADFDRHSFHQCVDADRGFYAEGQWDEFLSGAFVLRGLGFEFGRGHYYRVMPPDFNSTALDAGKRLQAMYYRPLNLLSKPLVASLVERRPFFTEAFARYLSWAAAHPEPGLDYRDQFHWNQRPGCWVGTTEQALDITETVRISIANCHHIFSLMNCATREERLSGAYQRAAIERFAPAFASIPVNPISRSRRTQARIARLANMSLKSAQLLARGRRAGGAGHRYPVKGGSGAMPG